ncbi:MAG: LysR family transcriptional regulator [Pseudomonadota bacterium]
MNHLEVKHLRMLTAIAESGNITKAAVRLCITQSALSQQLKDIEGKLGVAFFYRTSKSMLLTPVGKKLLEAARRIILALEEAEFEVTRSVAGEQGELKVGVQCIFCYKWLPGVVQSFQEKFPQVEFETGQSRDLTGDLESKRFDCVITAASTLDERFLCLPLFADQLVCIMAAAHPLTAKAWIAHEDFASFNLISHSEKEASRFYQLALKPLRIEPKRFMPVGQPQAIVEMVAAGLGLGIFPRWAISGALATGGIAARPIGKGGLPVTWFAAFLKNGGQLSVFQQEFVNLISRMKIDERAESSGDGR